MRKDYLEVINNLKAAVRIGHTDSILSAVRLFEQLPEIKSNAPIDRPVIEKLIFPAGKVLKSKMLQWETVWHLHRSPLAGTRALMANAAAHRWLSGLDIRKKELRKVGQDPRREVRDALILSLQTASANEIDPLWKMAKKWLHADSPRVQQCGILLLPTFVQEKKKKIFKLLASDAPNGNPDTNAALVEILLQFGKDGLGARLIDLLTEWAGETNPHFWVICKTISGSWAVKHQPECMKILQVISTKGADERLIERTYAALERNSKNKLTDL